MFIKKIMAYAAVSTLALGASFAQAAEANAPAAAVKPAVDAKTLLAAVPDVIGEYTVDGKVIKVDTKLWKAGVSEEIKIAAASGQPISAEMIKSALPQIANELVMTKVLPLEAARRGFKADLAQVKKEIEALKKQGTEEQFKQFLKAQGCATEEEFVKKVAPRQAVQQMVKSISDKLVVDEKAVKAMYDAQKDNMDYYECSHILAAFDAKNPRNEKITPAMEAAALKKIQDIKAKLDKGARFEDLAKSSSDCPSGKQGGLLGNYNPKTKMAPGQMVPEFMDAFNKLKPGEVTSAPVKTQFGYHLIKASQVKSRNFEEVKEYLANIQKQQMMQKKGAELLDSVKKNFKVKLYVK